MSGPSIPGPYHSSEQTEAFPLKHSLYRGSSAGHQKARGFKAFTSCCTGNSSEKNGGLRIIVMCFAVLTLAVILALGIQIYYGDYQLVPHGSVATDHHRCSTIGTDILKRGGNAVDAAIASTFCMGVVNFHITGLGRSGFVVLGSLANVHSHMSLDGGDLFNTLSTLQLGENYKLPNLAATLELIADKGPDVFYNGTLARRIVEIVNSFGGNMTVQDIASYQAVRRPPLIENFAGFNVFVPSLPSGGQALLEILKLLPDLNFTMGGQGLTPHFAINLVNAAEETYKSMLQGIWGDPSFENNEPDGGDIDYSVNFTKSAGSHVSAVDLNDLYVSVVSGLNTWLGSQIFVDESFILNNALINFGVGKNKPLGGKRPISYATPVIATEMRRICGRRLVFGSGDTTLALQVLARMLVLDRDIDLSIEAPRFHLENINKTVYLEEGEKRRLQEDNIQGLLNFSYQIKTLIQPYQSSNIVEKLGDDLTSHSDSRGDGMASRY
ncbi:hypothetical protein L9F63_013522 [Diploptera punctata]|uniref:Uncharacterized protein n=1 Tax=Diploptera punctata TaxID=6984 RepID=A0AAD8A9W4_DIPPU|nr:hypothetical protein L9F63_013522 [Diploptera punctata]